MQLLVQGNAAEDAANDDLAEAAAASLIAGRTISANAKKALEVGGMSRTPFLSSLLLHLSLSSVEPCAQPL